MIPCDQHKPWTRESLAAMANARGYIIETQANRDNIQALVRDEVLIRANYGRYYINSDKLERVPDRDGYRTCRHGHYFGRAGGCTDCTPLVFKHRGV